MNDEETFDVGHNVEELGFAYLFLKYLLPLVVGIIGIVVALIVGAWFLHFIVSLPTANMVAQ